MDSRKEVYIQTGFVAGGLLLCGGAMVGIYALLGAFSWKVLWGTVLGSVLSLLNFFFMAVGVTLAADKAVEQDVAGGQKLLRISQLVRYLALFGLLFAAGKSGFFEPLPLVLPLIFVRPILTLQSFFRKTGGAAL